MAAVVVAGFRCAWWVLPRLPEPLVLAGGSLAADVAWALRGPGGRRLEANLAAVEPDPASRRRLTRQGMRSYARYWCDAFRLHAWTPEQLLARTRLEGEGLPALEGALRSGRGAVAFLGHSGSWDQVGAWAAATWGRYGGVLSAAERLEPPEVFDAFVAFRARLGITAVPVEPGGAAGSGTTALLRGLRRGAFVPLLADRDLSGGGVDVTLLGRPSRAAAGPAALALATGAPLFPVTVRYEPGHGRRSPWRPWTAVAEVHPAVAVTAGGPAAGPGAPGARGARGRRQEQVAAMTQACVDVLSDAVRAHPADWHALQPFFDLPGPRATAPASAERAP